jgi:uncharacterized protein YjiS (DUF1127 family)
MSRRESPRDLHLPSSKVFALARVWRERQRIRRQLADMSERELQDVGTCRSDIACEIAKPFWRALVASNVARELATLGWLDGRAEWRHP